MSDRRRGRWIAFDASFFDGTLGVAIMEKFGPAGVTLFVGFLCACKRNLVQGQIEYGSTPDALSLMGVPGLVLVNDRGDAWDLQSFWRVLAAHKQCSTSRRGRLTQVKSSNWSKWQEGFTSQTEAQRKRRSEATITPENAPPKDRQKKSDRPLASGETETDTETDTDKTHLLGLAVCDPATPPPGRPPQAVATVFEAWLTSTGRSNRTILDTKRRRLIDRALEQYPLADVLDAVSGWRRSPHHRGENSTATVYNDLELLLRDAAHIEKFRDLERNPPGRPVLNHRPTTVDRSIATILEGVNDRRGSRPDSGGPGHVLASARAIEA